MISEDSQEGWPVDVAPVPFRLEGRDRLRRAGQQPGGILAGCARRSKPVPGDDAEVATAPASMPPPEVAMRVGRLPGRHHAARPSALVHGYHLDGIQIIRCERSEEHTSELQSPCNLVCRLLLEKKRRRAYAA